MWILKGISLGVGLFFVGSIVYIVNALRPIEVNKVTGISALLALTVWNPWEPEVFSDAHISKIPRDVSEDCR